MSACHNPYFFMCVLVGLIFWVGKRKPTILPLSRREIEGNFPPILFGWKPKDSSRRCLTGFAVVVGAVRCKTVLRVVSRVQEASDGH